MPSVKRSLWVRAPLLLVTLLQFAVPGAAAWADARLGEGSTGLAHIESHSTNVCARVHPADCAFHRFLNAPLARTPSAVIRVREGCGILWTPRVVEISRAFTGTALHHSRAPPPLS